MSKLFNHVFLQWNRYKRTATVIIGLLLVTNTLIVFITGGIPSAFAHTMYIPVLIAALYYGPFGAMFIGLLGGILVGPFMALDFFDVSTEPLTNSIYRLVYFVGLGGIIGLLFEYLMNRLEILHIQTEELSATLMSIGDGVIITDDKGIITSLNDVASTLLGVEAPLAIGVDFSEVFNIINGHTKARVDNPIETVLKTDQRIEIDRNTILIDAKGIERYIEDSASPIHSKSGQLIGVVIVFRDVTSQKIREDEILHISYHDYMTEIPNRRFFQESLDVLDNEKYYPLGIVLMDLNGLKVINDAYGHSLGNTALKQVAKLLDANTKETGTVARIGGDEFAMICPNTSEDELIESIQKIKHDLSKERIGNIEYSLAMGYDIKTSKDQRIRDVLKEAENRMYKHKVIEGKSTRNKAILSILQTLTDKYIEEKVHSERVSRLCRLIGEKMALRPDEIKELELAGMLHDIGKISIPDAILEKPGPLTQEEWEIMRQHTMNGYQILRAADEYSNLAEYAMSHHERIDGTGYPNQMQGNNIHLHARIISVADAYEAMTSDRPYRKALSNDQAKEELLKHAGTQFDSDIVRVFVSEVLSQSI